MSDRSLLVVGSVALDTVTTPAGRAVEVLGGSASFFAAAASIFAPPRVVAVVGDDFPIEQHLAFLRARGVDLAGLTSAPGRTFRWEGSYGENLNEAKTLRTELGVFAEFAPQLPEHFRSSRIVFLANIDPGLQIRVLEQVRGPELVALDTMNFWITNARAEVLRAIGRVHLVTVNDAEARALSGEHNLVRAARAIQRLGPRTVVVKRGEFGVLLFHEERVFAAPAFPLEEIRDPTGAGDSFAGGMMGYLARSGDLGLGGLRRSIVVGCVLGSFAVEDFSLERTRTLRLDEVTRRYELYRDLVGAGALREKLLED